MCGLPNKMMFNIIKLILKSHMLCTYYIYHMHFIVGDVEECGV